VDEYAKDYMYLSCIKFVNQVTRPLEQLQFFIDHGLEGQICFSEMAFTYA